MSRRTAWKLCSQAGILSSAQRRRRGKGKKAGPPVFDDHVQRVFRADAPNRLWLTDITEHWTSEGKLYCCAIKDVCSNRIVGYSISDRMTAKLAVDAVRNAVARRGVRLTPAALTLVTHTEAILRELEQAEAGIAASRTTISGTVRVATFQTAAHTLVMDAVDQLTTKHPDLHITFAHLSADDAIPALLARDFDLVLSEDYPGSAAPPHPGVATIAIMEDPLLLAIPADWAARRLTDLAEAPWVMEHPGTAARAWSTATCHAAGIAPQISYETSDLGLHAALVARGHAAAFLPQLGHTPSPAMQLSPTGDARTITVSTRTGSDKNPAIAALRQAITPS